MNYPAGCLRRQTDPVGPPASAKIHTGEVVPASGGINDQLDLLKRAAEMMATGALTEEQAKTLSRRILESVA
jgi:hypothetical protein